MEAALLNSVVLFMGGVALGALAFWLYHRLRLGSYQRIGSTLLAKASSDADALRRTKEIAFQQTVHEQQRELEKQWQQEREALLREERRLQTREDALDRRVAMVEKKMADIERREAQQDLKQQQIEDERQNLQATHEQLKIALEKAGGLSANEARDLLIEKMTDEARHAAAHAMRRITQEAAEQADEQAKKLLITAINRLSTSVVSEATITTVSLPNDDVKGRIIGREGRNIRVLERATGVNFIIDDTPGAVVLSGFDPLRLQVAKLALAELVADGRIHPTRIEEAVAHAKEEMHRRIRNWGEEATLKAGTMGLHHELILLLGRLKLRYSLGQNVLDHSVEVAHLMGLMAAELGLNVKMAKRIGLLHDIGKAVTHEMEGSHALIGHDLSLRYGESKAVATGIGCHHGEMEPTSLEGALCSAADAISASRPGGRVEAVEAYFERLQKLEALAQHMPGVDKAYAMQAGREVLVLVEPDAVDDDGVLALASDLTRRIEQQLTYPGKIKVTVVRERKATAFAV